MVFFFLTVSVYADRCFWSPLGFLMCCLCASTDGQEGSWEARWQHSRPGCFPKRLSSEDDTKELPDSSVKANGLSRQQVAEHISKKQLL